MKQNLYIFTYFDIKGREYKVFIVGESFNVAQEIFEGQDFQDINTKKPIYIEPKDILTKKNNIEGGGGSNNNGGAGMHSSINFSLKCYGGGADFDFKHEGGGAGAGFDFKFEGVVGVAGAVGNPINIIGGSGGNVSWLNNT